MAIDKEGTTRPEIAEAGADGGSNTGLETETETWSGPVATAEHDYYEPSADQADRLQNLAPRRVWWRMPPTFRYYLNLETVLYGLVIGLAIFLRFYNLSAQTLHHDEGVHAFYSWQYYNGQGYQQEPWKHGPFLYHVTALMFWLFGDNNETARFSTALFGVLTCLLPLALRKELGRWGALTASFLLTISPMFLYFSRFLREDIFVAFATLSLFISLVRFIDRPGARWWNFAMLSLALLFCTKEVSFFYLALFGGFILGWLGWQLAPRLLLIIGGYGLLALLGFFFVMKLYPPPPIPFEHLNGNEIGQYVGQLLVHPVFIAFVILGLVGVGVVWFALAEVAGNRRQFMLHRGWTDPSVKPSAALFAPYQQPGTVAYAVAWLGRHGKAALIGLALLFGFYFVFFTGFFSDIPQGSVGLFSGLWYWMAQQGVARGNQPWYYYFFMLPLYEPLALLLGTVASGLILFKTFQYGFRRQHRTVLMPISDLDLVGQSQASEADLDDELDDLSDPATANKPVANLRGHSQNSKLVEVEVALRPAGNALWPGRRRREPHPYFVPLLMVVWAFGSLALYTWASEKMPWLTVQLALPFIMLAAWLMDGVWSGIEEFFTSGEHRLPVMWGVTGKAFFWLQVGGLFATSFLAYMVMLNLTASEEKIMVGGGHFEWILIWVPPVVALLFFTTVFSFIGLKITLKATLAVVFAMLTIYLVHTGLTYAFDHGDVALEMGVYTQTTPDLYRVVQELDLVTSVLTDLKQTPVLYDNDLRTPMDFYLRHYTYKKAVDDFKSLTPASGSTLSLSDYEVIMIADSKAATLDQTQKKTLADNFISRHYTFHNWFEESQYRDFDRSISLEIAYLQNKPAMSIVKDANNSVVLNKDDPMTVDKLQQLAALPGVLDKVYNSNGGNATLLHLKEAGQSLYRLTTPGDFSRLWRYVMFREQFQPLGRREFTLYIKKDIAPMWRKYADLVPQPISGGGK